MNANGLVDAATNENLAEPAEKNRPTDSKFKQQKLGAWQPILTAGTVLPTFFIIGIVFIPCGVGFLYSSNQVFEKIIDYSDCRAVNRTTLQPIKEGVLCKSFENNTAWGNPVECYCAEALDIQTDLKTPVYFYYSLTNYYQNHRRYVKSRDDKQLLGNIEKDPAKISTDCDPYGKADGNLPIVPCGAIANSLFNDTFDLLFDGNQLGPNGDSTSGKSLAMTETGIAWSTDKTTKFHNPKASKDCKMFSPTAPESDPDRHCWFRAFGGNETARPLFWLKDIWMLDPQHPENNGFENEHFIVWMRTAALPNFRKLWGKLDKTMESDIYLKKGTYHILINYTYPVMNFGGRKRVILSTTSWLGGKNPFLGVAYIVVGSLCVLLGIVFLVIHLKFGKSLVEMSSISSS